MKGLISTLSILLVACQMEESRIEQPTEKVRTTTAVERAAQRSGQKMTGRATSADGTRIAYEKSGSGRAVIIVSGALAQRNLYGPDPLAGMLAEHFSVIEFDRRGRGESTDVQPYAVDREIEDIEALVNEAGGSACLYGVSSGAALALQAAAKLGPGKVTRLAIYDPPYGQPQQEFVTQKRRVTEVVRTGAQGEAAAYFLSAIGTPPETVETMKRSPQWPAVSRMDFTLAYDYAVLGDGAVPEEIVKTIRVPTLVMNGEKSMAFMLPAGDRIAELVPDGRRKTLPGQAHAAEAGVVAPLLIDFFRQ